MKMKNTNLVFWTIFMFVAFVIAGIFVKFIFQENPDYTIYKTECENETDTNIQYCSDKTEICNWTERIICHGDFVINCADKNKVDDCIRNNATECIYEPCMKILKENYTRNYKSCWFGVKEVCNKVEVDEIEYTDEIFAFDSECKRNCWDKYSGQWDKEEWNKCDEKCYWSILHDESISKKEITKEFLENPNNCECIQCEPLNPKKEWGWEAIKDGDKILTCSKECQKYKCGDYEVEVK